MNQVLFVCVANSGRSQMAEAFFNKHAEGWARAESAGTQPMPILSPGVVVAMADVGIDISHQRPKLLTTEMPERADKVITMGCDVPATCPATLVPTADWELEDPHGQPLAGIRRIRDEIESKVLQLLEELKSPETPVRE